MPLVKVKDRYQVTIPVEVREQVPLQVGDVIEVVAVGGHILLKPKVFFDRAEAPPSARNQQETAD